MDWVSFIAGAAVMFCLFALAFAFAACKVAGDYDDDFDGTEFGPNPYNKDRD